MIIMKNLKKIMNQKKKKTKKYLKIQINYEAQEQ